MASSTSQVGYDQEIQPSNTAVTGKLAPTAPAVKILDCCVLCDQGIMTVSCNICFRDTHRKCADAFLRATDKDIDNDLDNWRCPRCLTMLHLADPPMCEKNKNKKKV